MIQSDFPLTLQINRKHQAQFSNQEIVKVKILKQIKNNKWAVSIKGQIFPATTELKIKPGDTAFAKIFFQADHLLLKIQNGQSNSISQVIQQLQIPDEPVIHHIISLLMSEEMKISAENIRILQKALSKLKNKDPEQLKLLVIMLKKGINPNFEGLVPFLNNLQWGKKNSDPQKEPHRKQNKADRINTKELAQDIKTIFTQSESEKPGSIVIFNSLREDNPFWITLPYEFHYQTSKIKGNFKILWNNFKKSFDQWVIFIYIDNREIQVVINPSNKGYLMNFHCADDVLKNKIEKSLEELQKRIEPLKVRIQNVMQNKGLFSADMEAQEHRKYRAINWIT
ncbi:MAG: hypothetical protein JXR70_05275 [Spirochaetales bacterium]|nr:hypothetical protein [Spirochaetales bacterium]